MRGCADVRGCVLLCVRRRLSPDELLLQDSVHALFPVDRVLPGGFLEIEVGRELVENLLHLLFDKDLWRLAGPAR